MHQTMVCSALGCSQSFMLHENKNMHLVARFLLSRCSELPFGYVQDMGCGDLFFEC